VNVKKCVPDDGHNRLKHVTTRNIYGRVSIVNCVDRRIIKTVYNFHPKYICLKFVFANLKPLFVLQTFQVNESSFVGEERLPVATTYRLQGRETIGNG
jgi:hypothetical protein